MSRISDRTVTRPFELGIEELVHRRHGVGAQGLLQCGLVPPEGAEAGLPGQRVLAVGVEGHALPCRQQVRRVRDQCLVELLGEAVLDPQRRHPVGQDDEVAADVLALLELRADLGVELVVVVDVLGVGDRDPCLRLEGLQGRTRSGLVVDVDVQRPVGPVERLVRVGQVGLAGSGRRARGLRGPLVTAGAACGGDHRHPADARCLQEASTRDRRPHASGDGCDGFGALRCHD